MGPRRRRHAGRRNATAVAAAACSILLTCSCGSAVGDEGPRAPTATPVQQPQATAPLMDAPPAPVPAVPTGPAPAVTAPALQDAPALVEPGDEQPISLVIPDPSIRDMQDLLRSFGEPGVQSTGVLDPATQVGVARFQRCLPEAERPDALGDIHRRMQGLNAVGWTFTLCDGAFDTQPAPFAMAGDAPDAAQEPADAAPAPPPGDDATLTDGPADAPAQTDAAPAEPPPQVAMLPPPPPPSVTLAVGQGAYAIESISCEGASGSWVLLYRGTVAALGAESVDIDVESRIGLRYWPEAEGVNESDWFCVPRRRFCYAPVAFTDWKGKVKANDRISSSRSQVFDDALGPRGVQQFIQSKCGS